MFGSNEADTPFGQELDIDNHIAEAEESTVGDALFFDDRTGNKIDDDVKRNINRKYKR